MQNESADTIYDDNEKEDVAYSNIVIDIGARLLCSLYYGINEVSWLL